MPGLRNIIRGKPHHVRPVPPALAACLASGWVLCWAADNLLAGSQGADAGSNRPTACVQAPRDNQRPKRKRGNGSDADKAKASKADAARGRARRAIRDDDHALAERLIREGLKTRLKAERDTWHLVESELAFARKQYARSGLIAMRIVILRPRSRQVGAALYRAARAYERLGRSAKAVELYSECADHNTARGDLRKQATKRLEKLSKRQAKP